MRKSGSRVRLGSQRRARRLRADAAVRRHAVHPAVGRLQAARPAPRRDRRVADHRRNGRAARRLDRPGAPQHRRGAARAAGRPRRQDDHRRASQRAARRHSAGTRRRRAAQLRRRPVDRPPQISRRDAADQARQGPRLDARAGRGDGSARRPASTTPCSSTPRIRSRRAAALRSASSGSPAASSVSARPTSAGSSSSITPRWSISRRARSCGSTSSRRGSQIPGIKFGDLRTPEGAAQMVERLLGRMKPGRAVREQQARERH